MIIYYGGIYNDDDINMTIMMLSIYYDDDITNYDELSLLNTTFFTDNYAHAIEHHVILE